MNTKRLEYIVIMILLLLNAFLLIVVLSDDAEERSARRETEASLTALLASNGIEVGEDVDLIRDCPAQCTVVRDMAMERERMRGLLGAHQSEDLGGSIWFYSSERGQAMMRGTGEMDLLMTGETVARGDDPDRTAKRLFSRAGVELYALGTETDDGSAELCGVWNGCPVFNARLSFAFSGERLYMVSGTMLFNRETDRGDVGMDSVSVLVRFVDLAKSEGFICSRIEALSPGYMLSVTMSGESTLIPVWRIGTDTGDFIVNAVSGRTENLL